MPEVKIEVMKPKVIEGFRRRITGALPKPKPEEPKSQEEKKRIAVAEKVIEPTPDDEIARLEAEKKSLVITNQRPSLVTPGMAAQKPVVALNELNKKHAVITNLGGKCVVMEWATSQIDPRWEEPAYQTFTAFRERYANRYIEIVTDLTDGKTQRVAAMPAAHWWLARPARRQFDGLDLVPNGPGVLPGNRLNLWRGWGVEPER